MDMTASMLMDRLDVDTETSVILQECALSFRSARMFLPGVRCLSSDAVYVMSVESLSTLEEVDPAGLVIVSGVPAKRPRCSFLVSRLDPVSTWDAVFDAFEACSRFDGELKTLLLAGRDMESLLKVCSVFFRNWVEVLDPAFNVVGGWTPVLGPDNGQIEGYERDASTFSPDTLDEMSRQNLLRETHAFRRAQFHKSAMFDYRAVIANLFHEGQMLGKLLIIENATPLGPSAPDIADRIAPYFLHLMRTRAQELDISLHAAEHFIAEAVRGNLTDGAFLSGQLARRGWRMNDRYAVLAIRSSNPILTRFHLQAVKEQLPEAVPFPAGEWVAAMMRLGDPDAKILENRIERLLERLGLQGGISESFSDFLLAPMAFLQAKAALETAQRLDSTGKRVVGRDDGSQTTDESGESRVTQRSSRLHRYRDQAVGHLCLAVHDAGIAQALLHPGVEALIRYDEAHRAGYLETLQVYLESGANQVQAAVRLHIHRKTLQYRLERLERIAAIRADDPSEWLRLMVSIQLRELGLAGHAQTASHAAVKL